MLDNYLYSILRTLRIWIKQSRFLQLDKDNILFFIKQPFIVCEVPQYCLTSLTNKVDLR